MRRVRRAVIVLAALALLLAGAHLAIGRAAGLEPPPIEIERAEPVTKEGGIRVLGRHSVRKRGAIFEVRLEGSPEEIGWAHSRLLYEPMVANEGAMLEEFERQVSFRLARTLLLDLAAQLRYRSVDRGMSEARLREIAAGAQGFQPDPYSRLFPTFQRFVYLNALYDISLSFEHSPLIGCTSFALAEPGAPILARAFDFDVHDIFDREKAVFLVRENGKIPFASVAWPGLVGVVSGMNAEGLGLVVHGGRAGGTRAEGEPVVHSLRRVLSTARTLDEAAKAFAEGGAMVSHLVVAMDASARSAVIERVPGEPPHVRLLPARAAITNHFEGPAAADPADARVREKTSTLARRARADELLASLPSSASPADAVRLLRDRKGAGGTELELGDRRAIDALIATHGVVMEPAARRLWVSESPHLLGRFLLFELDRLLGEETTPAPIPDSEVRSIPADPMALEFRPRAR
jgi:isopenicillin-N N-acyltransferase like protein